MSATEASSFVLGAGVVSSLHDAADPARDEVEVEAHGHDEDDGELDGLPVRPVREVHGGRGFESQILQAKLFQEQTSNNGNCESQRLLLSK